MKNALVAASFALALIPALASAQTSVAPVGPATVTPGAPVAGQHGDRHPEIKKAIRHLEEAKQALQSAAHDYSGHRDDAIRLIDQAEAQLRTGITAANGR